MPAEQFSEKISLLTNLRNALRDLECVADLELEVSDATELVHGVATLRHDASFRAFNDVVSEYPIELGQVEALEGARTEKASRERTALTLVSFNEVW